MRQCIEHDRLPGGAGPIAHPTLAVALAVLVLNDHVLKDLWPGLVTGKLSDIAGVFVVAVVASALTGRRSVGLGLTAIGFVALKLSATVAVAAAPVLGGVTRQDPTDLLALAALPLAARHVRATSRPDPPGREAGAGPVSRQDLERVLMLVLLGTTSLAVTATSCLEHPGVQHIGEDGDGVYALVGVGTDSTDSYRSTDGGRTWSPGGPAARGREPASAEACLSDGRCFRVVDHERVSVRPDGGTWETAFEFTPEEIRRMERRTDGCSGRGDVRELFDSVAVVGRGGADGGGAAGGGTDAGTDEVVLVSMATQGVLRFDPATGEWTRHGVGPTGPLDLYGPRWLAWLGWAPVAGLVLTPLLMVFFLVRDPTARLRRILAAAVALLVLGIVVVGALFAVAFGRPDYADFGIGLTVITLVVLGVTVAVMAPRGRSPSP